MKTIDDLFEAIKKTVHVVPNQVEIVIEIYSPIEPCKPLFTAKIDSRLPFGPSIGYNGPVDIILFSEITGERKEFLNYSRIWEDGILLDIPTMWGKISLIKLTLSDYGGEPSYMSSVIKTTSKFKLPERWLGKRIIVDWKDHTTNEVLVRQIIETNMGVDHYLSYPAGLELDLPF